MRDKTCELVEPVNIMLITNVYLHCSFTSNYTLHCIFHVIFHGIRTHIKYSQKLSYSSVNITNWYLFEWRFVIQYGLILEAKPLDRRARLLTPLGPLLSPAFWLSLNSFYMQSLPLDEALHFSLFDLQSIHISALILVCILSYSMNLYDASMNLHDAASDNLCITDDGGCWQQC